ncbi:hypothetical protein DS884_00940 [Tenacibaculum sp. E3R01]|uniref:hypothetical protein n=1 Tax=Tenacibaculum sp. E3R01 TaxID=2267227 RepID=UPI000DEB9618|nr:hypothetical protein [Tenacibaculum sp. E3R01]RBW62910.1 hypothetical protein DS884_00940 [Tenacibaculum sp. E3R01]
MNKLILVFVLLAIVSCSNSKTNQEKALKAQEKQIIKEESKFIIDSTSEKEEVLNAILRFHNGMRQKDGELAISAWEKTAAGYTISIDSLGNSTKKIEEPVDEGKLDRIKNWLNNTKDDLDEEIFDVRINIDGELAMAWVPYNFYRNNQFSHSGTNAFILMKFDNIWKIISVADTRYFGKKIHK